MTTRTRPNQTMALGLAVATFLVGAGVPIFWAKGFFSIRALLLVTAGLAAALIPFTVGPVAAVEAWTPRLLRRVVAAAIAAQAAWLLRTTGGGPGVLIGIVLIASLGLALGTSLARGRVALLTALGVVFTATASVVFLTVYAVPPIDVFSMQQETAAALLRGVSPFSYHLKNMYDASTTAMVYGPGVVGPDNYLTVGYSYPPLSLLLVLPGYLLGDCRYAGAASIALSAWLMGRCRPHRWTGLVATLLLLTPIVFEMVSMAWTEASLALTFSAVMYCSVRWKRGLPWALGLFFATKQYTVLMAPLVWLLVSEDDPKAFVRTLAIACGVTAAVTLPFVLWDFDGFMRSVVYLQFIQRFRYDSLSYATWVFRYLPQLRPVLAVVAFVLLVPAMTLVLRRCPRTPGGFAAASTIVYLVFLVFNKQAFTNYYYFGIVMAAWAAATCVPAGWLRDEPA